MIYPVEIARDLSALRAAKVGGKVDLHRLTQVGRALRELGVQMIPAYSPPRRGGAASAASGLGKGVCTGAAAEWDHYAGGGQWISTGALHRRVQWPLHAAPAQRGPRSGRYSAVGFFPSPSPQAPYRSGKELTRFSHPFTNCGNFCPNA